MARQRQTPEQKLAALQAKQAQINERIRQESAKVKAQERKQDTRRKILAGAVALEHAKYDAAFAAALDQQIAKNVTRADDRALFNLPPLNGNN